MKVEHLRLQMYRSPEIVDIRIRQGRNIEEGKVACIGLRFSRLLLLNVLVMHQDQLPRS